MTRNYYLGPFVWHEPVEEPTPEGHPLFGIAPTLVVGDGYFAPPDGAVGVVDLRSIPGHADVPFGFFVMPDDRPLGEDYVLFGVGHLADVVLTEQAKSRWASMLGIAESIESVALLDLLWDTLTIYSDPTGDDRCKPLVPTNRLKYELHLGGHSLVRHKRCRPNGDARERAEWAKTLAVVQAGLLRVREDARGGKMIDPETGQVDGEYHQRIVKATLEKYRLPFETLRPKEWPARETPLAHRTTIVDDFSRADGDTIGNQLTWTEVAGDWDTVSNHAALITTGVHSAARAESDLSSVDHYSQVVIDSVSTTNTGRWLGAAARFSASEQTYYGARLRFGQVDLISVAMGTPTILDGLDAVSVSLPDTIKVEPNGSTIRSLFNDVAIHSVTDTSIATGTRCGLNGQKGGSVDHSISAFQAADLAAPPAGGPFPHHTRRVMSGGMSYMQGGVF